MVLSHLQLRTWDVRRPLCGDWGLRPEHFDEFAHPRWIVRPRASGHHLPVHNPSIVHEFRASGLHIGLKRRICSRAAALQCAGRGEHQRCVTQLCHGKVALHEVSYDALHIWVVTDVFGRAPAGNYKRDIL